MALPVSPAPKSDDVASFGWSGLTVRVAWTLLSQGVKIRAEVLDAARRHVLYHLSPSTTLGHAEDRATHLTRQFVAQAKGRFVADPWPGDAEMPLTDRWAKALDAIGDRTSRAVFRMHYGDHRSLSHIEGKLGLDRIAVEAARGGLREVLRGVARRDGLPLDTWPNDRLDRVLTRLASWAPESCPPTYDVINGAHRSHVRGCARCNRTVRLVNAGALEGSDLQPPTLRARPRDEVKLLALHFHPDGRHHRAGLIDALTSSAHPMGEDILLVEVTDRETLHATLRLAAEVGMPNKQHLRGAVVTGPGSWSRFGPLGPLGSSAAQEVRSRSWGTIDGLGSLPATLPEAPHAQNAWGIVAGLAAAAAFALWIAAQTAASPPPGPFVEFAPTHDSLWASFDVPELDSVHVIGFANGDLDPLLLSAGPADKAELAVGDGSYRILIPGRSGLIVTSADPLPLDSLIAAASQANAPLAALSDAVQRMHPSAHVFLHSR